MANGFYNDYEERLLTEGSDTKYEQDPRTEQDPEPDDCYVLPPVLKARTLIWSVISFIAGILSILLCPFYYLSFILSAVAVCMSLISRRNLGYFEKFAIMVLIFGLVGFVFGVFSLIAGMIGLFV